MATAMPSKPLESRPESFTFTLLISGFSEITTAVEAALFEAGCDDALLGIRNSQAFLDFDREAPSLVEAIRTAIEDVERNKLGIKVVQVVPPGAQVMNLVNAYLRLRESTPEFAEMIDRFFKELSEHRPQA